jgi:hypothetical protein
MGVCIGFYNHSTIDGCSYWAAIDGMPQKRALHELYNMSTTFLFWTLTPFAQKGSFLHQPSLGS